MNIINLKEVDSTNKYAKENIEKLDDRTIISTDIQTAGYGRFNRSWVDLGSENIYMTFVLKPSEEIKLEYACLTQYLSVCLCEYLKSYGLFPKIKWPNDVLINKKKVCGILAEAVIKGGKLKGIVLGIGINLNAKSQNLAEIDRPATALNLELGRIIDKPIFINELVNIFFKDYDNFLKDGFNFIKQKYEEFSILQKSEKVLNVAVFNKVKTGYFKGFDLNGNLILLTDFGEENLNMGELC